MTPVADSNLIFKCPGAEISARTFLFTFIFKVLNATPLSRGSVAYRPDDECELALSGRDEVVFEWQGSP